VLPEHRRMVLAEAADLAESMVKTWPGMGDQAKAGNEHLRQAARRIRRLAAAAPETTLSATVPAEPAPAVPEDTPGGFHEPDEPTDRIAAAFDAGAHGRTAPPRGQTRRLDVAADDAQETIRRLTAERDTLKAFVNPAEHVRKMRQENDRQRSEFIEKLMLEVVEERTRAEKAEADRDRLAAQVERVRALHKPELFAGVQACLACSPGMPPPTLIEWPCPTIAAVDALPDAPATDGQDGDGRG
jgi:hypothetical protein